MSEQAFLYVCVEFLVNVFKAESLESIDSF